MAGIEISLFQAPPNAPASIDDFTTSVLSAAACYPSLVGELLRHDAFIVACYSDHPLIQMLREGTLKRGLACFTYFVRLSH